MVDPNLSRRLVLTGTAAALASPVAAVTAARAGTGAPNPDAALLALGRDLDEAWAHEWATVAALAGDDSDEADDKIEAAFASVDAVVEEIEHISATTLDGLRVKAKAVSWCHSGEVIGPSNLNEQETTDVRLASSIVRDLLALAGEAAHG